MTIARRVAVFRSPLKSHRGTYFVTLASALVIFEPGPDLSSEYTS